MEAVLIESLYDDDLVMMNRTVVVDVTEYKMEAVLIELLYDDDLVMINRTVVVDVTE